MPRTRSKERRGAWGTGQLTSWEGEVVRGGFLKKATFPPAPGGRVHVSQAKRSSKVSGRMREAETARPGRS